MSMMTKWVVVKRELAKEANRLMEDAKEAYSIIKNTCGQEADKIIIGNVEVEFYGKWINNGIRVQINLYSTENELLRTIYENDIQNLETTHSLVRFCTVQKWTKDMKEITVGGLIEAWSLDQETTQE